MTQPQIRSHLVSMCLVLVAVPGAALAEECEPNFSGGWSIQEQVTVTSDPDGVCASDSQSYTLTLSQSGTSISGSSSAGSVSGGVSGSRATFSGQSIDEDGGTTTFTKSVVFKPGGLSLRGTSVWTWSNEQNSCAGTSRVTGTRTSSAQNVCALEVCAYTSFAGYSHVWLEVAKTVGTTKVESVHKGLNPYGSIFGFDPGKVSDEKDTYMPTNWSKKICYSVNGAQYNSVRNEVNSHLPEDDGPIYNLFLKNCVDYVADTLGLADITIPPHSYFGLFSDPSVLDYTLGLIGDGGVYDDGFVTTNPQQPQPFGPALGEPPPCQRFSVVALVLSGLADPVTTAADLQMPLNDNVLDPVMMVAGGSLPVSFTGMIPADAVLAVDWGDGADIEGTQLSYAHVYDNLGTYELSGLVINTGAVHHFSVTVQVSASGTPAPVVFNVPVLPPANASYNAECPAGEPLPPIDTPAAPGRVPTVMTMDRTSPSTIQLAWEESLCSGEEDYAIYKGVIGDWDNHVAADCIDDGGDRTEEILMDAGSTYYLVVPLGASAEGSYGETSGDVERPQASNPCRVVQDLICTW